MKSDYKMRLWYAQYLLQAYYKNGGKEDSGMAVRLAQFIREGSVNNLFSKNSRLEIKLEFLKDARNKIVEFVKQKDSSFDLMIIDENNI